jgi:putative tryptophan/tyrosine transport system substrate-binding protein
VKRREFVTLLGSMAAAPVFWSRAAHAQQPAMPVIGFLSPATADDLHADRVDVFRQGLGEAGFVEGQNVTIEYRWANNQNNQLPVLAADLVRRQVAVIAVPLSTPGALAAKAATTTIPVVFYVGSDPVALGLVASLSRPGGNLTGVTSLSVQVGAKRLELVHELLPKVNIIALLVNPTSPLAQTEIKDEQAAAEKLGLELHVLQASTERDFDEVFANVVKLRAGALVIGPDSLFTSRQKDLAAMALRHSVPAIYQFHAFAAAGGLMSYGASLSDYHQLGVFTGRILKGEKPADLPVQQSTKVELTINLKTAKALGLTVPLTLLGRADEVIE